MDETTKRLPSQQLHITLTDPCCMEGMTIELDCDVNDLPHAVVNALNVASGIGIEGRDEVTVGFHVKGESPCAASPDSPA